MGLTPQCWSMILDRVMIADNTSPDAHVLRLHTADLTSKWGFEDGDLMISDARLVALLQDVYQMTGQRVDSTDLLIEVVRRWVLPYLDQQVELANLGTLHNPARAVRVNGVPLDLYGNPPDGHKPVCITPETVDVPLQQVRDAAMRLALSSGGA